MDSFNLLNIYRTIDLEPSERDLTTDKYLEIAARCFARGLPLVISVHAINFQSALKDFRSLTLARIDQLLSALERKYAELRYVHDEDLYQMVAVAHHASGEEVVCLDSVYPEKHLGHGVRACP